MSKHGEAIYANSSYRYKPEKKPKLTVTLDYDDIIDIGKTLIKKFIRHGTINRDILIALLCNVIEEKKNIDFTEDFLKMQYEESEMDERDQR